MRLGILVLIGLPGSGKTTLAKNLTRNFYQYNGSSHNFIHVCYDDLISFPNGNYDFEWKSARNSVLVKIESFVRAIKNKNFDLCPSQFCNVFKSIKCWEGDFVLIIDDNMYFRSMRYSLFQIAKKHSISFCQVYLNCSIESALQNNSLRKPETVVPPDVITKMNAKIEPPNCKNNWEKYSIELNEFCNLNEICCELLHFINVSLNNFFCEKDDDSEDKKLCKMQCKKSLMHQSDIALRRIINCKIKNYICENPREKSQNFITELNLRKSELLSDIKARNICLPDEVLDEINSDTLEKVQLMKFLKSYF